MRTRRVGRRFGMRVLAACRVPVVLALACATAATAQSRFGGWGQTELSYDGQLTFVRLGWRDGTYGAPTAGGGVNFWLHEFPRAEQNLMSAVGDFTLIDARTDGSLLMTLGDPELFKHPIVTMWEPGFWTMTEEEAVALRQYLQKGGFVIFNDFEGPQWANFEAQTKRVIPGAQWLRLDDTHPVFDTFFRLEDTAIHAPNPLNHHLRGRSPEYFGLFEDNDPSRRMMAIANYNTNLGEYWQTPEFYALDALSRAFGLGVNYMIYGMTH
jgi:hypothetical protein